MESRIEKLTTTDWAVLVFLLEGEVHGFRVASVFGNKGELADIWRVQRTQIYRSIEHLVAGGLAQPVRQETGEAGPPRTLYVVTPKGLEAAQNWLETPVGRLRMGRSDLRLKLAFLARAGRDPRALIQRQRGVYQKQLNELTQTVPKTEIERIAHLWRIEMAEASLRFLEQLVD